MISKFRINFIFSLILSIFLLFSFVYSCDYSPDIINVYSSNNLIGEFESGNIIYIRDDLSRYPLTFEYIFQNSEDNCFSSDVDMKMKFFSDGRDVYSNSWTKSTDSSYYIDTFKFDISTTADLPEQFLSQYYVLIGTQNHGNFNLVVDRDAPKTDFNVNSGITVYSKNSTAKIIYSVQDLKSGLKNVRISNCYSLDKDININEKNDLFSGQFNVELTTTKSCSITTEDLIGNTYSKNIKLVVDSNPPIIFSQNGKDYSKSQSYSSLLRRLNLEVKFQDDSFNLSSFNLFSNVNIDFSTINSQLTNVAPTSCIKDESYSDVYICNWNNIIIDTEIIPTSKTVNFPISIYDALSNEATLSVSVPIEVDTNGPEILDFFLSNYKFTDNGNNTGVTESDYQTAKSRSTNILSGYDKNSFVYLKFKDDTIDEDVLLIPEFAEIPLPMSNCNKNSNIYTCIWDLGTSVNIYQGESEYKNLNFKVSLRDYYGNPTTETINITLDNIQPKIKNDEILLIETEDIKDRIVKSGEIVDFVVYIQDDYLVNSNYYNVFGDFSKISIEENSNNKQARCSIYNSTSYECKFKDVKVANGYLNSNIFVYVNDMAGNFMMANKTIEILKIADEEVHAFKQNLKYETLNPVNRNLLLQSDVDTWFEGNIEFNSIYENSGMRIVSFQLKECDESGLDPLIAIEYDLFPYNIVFNENDYDFQKATIKVNLKDHSNANDMDFKSMTCTLSVLKRDNQTIYAPELVNISLKFGFYAIPRGDILNAHVESLLSDIEKTEVLGGTFDSMFDIYKSLKGICSITNNVNNVMSTVTGVWMPISIVLDNIPVTKAIAKAGNAFIPPTDGMISTILNGVTGKSGPVKLMCDFVTCRNGGWIGAGMDFMAAEENTGSGIMDYGTEGNTYQGNNKGGGAYSTLINVQKKIAGAVCSKEISNEVENE